MAELGEVEITLNGKTEILKSTLRAARIVNGIGGFSEAFRKLAAYDLGSYVTIVAAGLNRSPSVVEEAVYKTGLTSLVEPLAVYVGYLSNGGKPLPTTDEVPSAGEA